MEKPNQGGTLKMKKFLIQEDVPCWYHLFWDRKREGLMIRIHKFFIENCEYQNFEPYFREFIGGRTYLPLFDRCEPRLGQSFFGINDSIKLIDQDEEWMTYQIKIPPTIYASNFACIKCEGTGRRQPEEYDEICHACKGKKTKTFLDYIQIDEVCFSLSTLLSALQFSFGEYDVPTSHKQLFTLKSRTEADREGHSVGGHASPELMRFLESLSTSTNEGVDSPSVVEVMRKVHVMMCGTVKEIDRFACYTKGGQITLDCPGNACFIKTDGNRSVGGKRGDEISSHNLDNPKQQMMLFCGMGEISSLYDDWIVKH